MDKSKQMMVRVFKAFGDENRLTILGILQEGEKCACKLQEALSISQPTLSHHMRVLLDGGLVNARREGKWIYYSLNAEGVLEAKNLLCGVLGIE